MARGVIKPPMRGIGKKVVVEGSDRKAKEKTAARRSGGARPKELRDAMDHFTVEGLTLLWEIANDPEHEWHSMFGFDALKHLVTKCAPARSELKGEVGGKVELSLPSLFYGDSLPSKKITVEDAVLIEDKAKEPEDSM